MAETESQSESWICIRNRIFAGEKRGNFTSRESSSRNTRLKASAAFVCGYIYLQHTRARFSTAHPARDRAGGIRHTHARYPPSGNLAATATAEKTPPLKKSLPPGPVFDERSSAEGRGVLFPTRPFITRRDTHFTLPPRSSSATLITRALTA